MMMLINFLAMIKIFGSTVFTVKSRLNEFCLKISLFLTIMIRISEKSDVFLDCRFFRLHCYA